MRKNKNLAIEAVLFDWDGTLLDSYQADSAAYLAMFKDMGVAWGLDDLARHYSPNWYEVYRAAKLHRSRWDAADLAWRGHYAKQKPRLIPGARRILARVARTYRLGLVTSGDRVRVMRQLQTFRLAQMFATHVCSGDTVRKKPHPAPLRLALRQMGIHPSACIYVGDSPEDLEMARRAGVRSIAVISAFPTEKRLRKANPNILLEALDELPAAIEVLARANS